MKTISLKLPPALSAGSTLRAGRPRRRQASQRSFGRRSNAFERRQRWLGLPTR